MELAIDLRWLLARQTEVLPEDLGIDDYSALAAAVARHRVNTPRLGETTDAAWRAASLLHTLVLLRPLPTHNALYGCGVATAYMHGSAEGIDPPYGALIELVREVQAGESDVYSTAGALRAWRV